jgi:putative hydrolase of the HAD superfamily
MAIHTLFFDFGNVVADFDHRRATRRFAERSHLPETAIFDAIYNTQLEDDFEAGRLGADEFVAQAMAVISYRGTPDQFVAEFVDIFTPNSAVVSLIPRLSGKYRLILASNTNVLHAAHFRQQMVDTLDHFHALGLSYEAGARKPHPPFYAYCQSFAAGPPGGGLFIDDIGMNVEAARAFGWRGVQFKTLDGLVYDLRRHGVGV